MTFQEAIRRQAKIRAMIKVGMNYREIGKALRISYQRICQINKAKYDIQKYRPGFKPLIIEKKINGRTVKLLTKY